MARGRTLENDEGQKEGQSGERLNLCVANEREDGQTGEALFHHIPRAKLLTNTLLEHIQQKFAYIPE